MGMGDLLSSCFGLARESYRWLASLSTSTKKVTPAEGHNPWKLPDTVDAEDREDAIVAAVKRGHKVVIVGYRRVSEGLNPQIVDSIIWFEMAQHLILLTQASQRAWRLGKQGEVRVFYLAYASTVSHEKLKQLASQGGAAALF